MAEIIVRPDAIGLRGRVLWPGAAALCVLGRGGVRPAADKREGDGATPAGRWPIRRVLWRPDRLDRPSTALPVMPIGPDDGWCDDPACSAYSRPVGLPHPGSHERLWREDGLYDVVVILGHNDSPPVPGLGSAIFLHVARPDLGPTEGCVAMARDDLLALLVVCGPSDSLVIELPAS